MGSGNSTPVKVEPTNPFVQQLFIVAETQVEEKEIQKAIASYQKAQSITTNNKVKEYINFQISSLSLKDTDPRPSARVNEQKLQKSQEVTAKFEDLFEEFKENVVSPKKYIDAVKNIEVIMQVDCRQVKSVGTYFNSLMLDIVCDVNTYQGIDTDQTDNIKENIMVLLKDLAFVHFQNNLSIGLKISSEKHAEMINVINAHIKWMLKSESKELSFTTLYFLTDYLLDILKLMSTTDSLSDKMNLSNTAMDVFSECLSLNISGACVVLSKNVCAGIVKVAKEQIHGTFSKKTLSKLIQYKALTKTIDQLLKLENGSKMVPAQVEAYETFFQELDYAYSHRLNWKIYVQLLNDLYEIFKATPKANVSMRLKLIQGDASKKHKGLCHFCTFAKFSFMSEQLEKKNWRIRETALRIALKLWWEVGDDGNDIYDALQAVICSYGPRLEKEHIVIKHIVKKTTMYKKVFEEMEKRAMDQTKLAKETANLVGSFGNDLNNALKEMVDEQKHDAGNVARNNAIEVLEKDIDDMADNMEGDDGNPDNAPSMYLKIQASRIRGDKAEAKGDYRDAIAFYLKWKTAVIEMNNGDETCADLMKVLVTLGGVYESQGEYETSMEYLNKALPMQVKEFGTEEHVDVGETYGKMGWTCSRMGRYDQAMEYCMKSLKIRLKVLDEGHVDV
eukprot:g9945.t1